MPDIGHIFTTLDSVDSTNNYAMAKVHAGLAKHGNVYMAREQTLGKGQRGKEWNTEPGQNLTLSVVLEPETFLNTRKFLLSAAIALSCHDVISSYAGEETKIKWPNDIYWRDRKAGGILIENLLKASDWKYAIVGIGLNINQVHFDESLKNPVSLKQITGKNLDVYKVAKELCKKLEARYEQLCSDLRDQILKEYNQHLYKLGELAKLKYNNIAFESLIRSVNADGNLLANNAIKEEFSVGEVEWVL